MGVRRAISWPGSVRRGYGAALTRGRRPGGGGRAGTRRIDGAASGAPRAASAEPHTPRRRPPPGAGWSCPPAPTARARPCPWGRTGTRELIF